MRLSADKCRLPVPFVVGTGRCGTTLLRLMLDAHPDLAIPPETHFIPKLYSNCMIRRDRAARQFMDSITSSKYWNDFHMDAELLRQRIETNTPFDLGESLRTFYGIYAEGFGKRRWGDKTPSYWESMSLINQILPEVRFIHLIRDGRDTALSVIKDHWGPASISDAAEWWVHGIKRARAQARELQYYLEIRYENLVCDPEITLQQICRFIDLPWNKSMLDYHRHAAKRLDELEPVQLEDKTLSKRDRQGHFHLTSKPPTRSRIGI